MALGWKDASQLGHAGWACGYCGREVGGSVGYQRERNAMDGRVIYICPHCENPTAFIMDAFGQIDQIPTPACGSPVEGLPEPVGALYDEARRCVQYTAYTSAAMAMRKLLMHVAVDKGAEPDKSFACYVDYLDTEGWIPPSGRDWVDELRKGGNEAAHELVMVGEDDARRLLGFTEMLLRLAYEFPARMAR